MRTVSFADNQVQKAISNNFVSTYTNIEGDPTSGMSFEHAPNTPAGQCGSTAGRQNVQTIFMTPKKEIFHVACGFQTPEELLKEMKLASGLFQSLQKQKDDAARRGVVTKLHQKELAKVQKNTNQNSPFRMFTGSKGHLPDQLMSMAPSDQGFNLGGSDQLSSAIVNSRLAKDHDYLIRHPLIQQEQFSQDPGELVGRGKTFFGTMNHGSNFGSDFGMRRSR